MTTPGTTPDSTSRHVGVYIARRPTQVREYVADPAHLPVWAAGLAGGVERVDGRWYADSPMGRVAVSFAAPNPWGVLDHDVELPSGEVVTNPVRVVANGSGSDLVFTVQRQPGVGDAQFEADVAAVAADLRTLKQVLEEGRRQP
ncbi:MAG: SRPBCC family protein [Pseudonocardia sp.]|nr:SRPBCC family protein [Pseudonocardia sp.]